MGEEPIPPPRKVFLNKYWRFYCAWGRCVYFTNPSFLALPWMMLLDIYVIPRWLFAIIPLDWHQRINARGTHLIMAWENFEPPLILLVLFPALFKKFRFWNFFWAWYFVTTSNTDCYFQNVMESWSRSLRAAIPTGLPMGQSEVLIPLVAGQAPDIWSFTMFVDNKYVMRVPCAVDIVDREFIEHLWWCQCFWTTRRGPLSQFSLLVLGRVEIAKVGGKSR